MGNRFYLTLLFLSGVVLLLFMSFSVYREVTPEWKTYQSEYKTMAVNKAKDGAMRKQAEAMKVDLQQIYVGSLKRVDRCTSCHAGVENPGMEGARLPFTAHSGDYLKNHSLNKYGCTVCHYGQGRALTRKEAHGLGHDTHWDFPTIPLKYIQSSCASCHSIESLKTKGGENVAKGEALFRERGCKGCHKLEGVGGVLGKALDGVGSQPIAYFPMRFVQGERTVYAWMKEHFDDPRTIVPASEMKAEVTDAESDLLTTYVLSLRSEEMPKKYRKFEGTNASAAGEMNGEALYKMYCIACHTTGKDSIYDEVFKRTIPAIMNPAFLKVADDKFLKKVLSEGRAGTQMTAWKESAAGLTDKEVDKIIEYVAQDRPAQRPEPFGIDKYLGNPSHGEELFAIRCVSCHGNKGQGGVGLNLRNPIIQKEADPEFIAITIRDGREGTHMAAFGKEGVGLENQDIADLVAYVRTLSKKK